MMRVRSFGYGKGRINPMAFKARTYSRGRIIDKEGQAPPLLSAIAYGALQNQTEENRKKQEALIQISCLLDQHKYLGGKTIPKLRELIAEGLGQPVRS